MLQEKKTLEKLAHTSAKMGYCRTLTGALFNAISKPKATQQIPPHSGKNWTVMLSYHTISYYQGRHTYTKYKYNERFVRRRSTNRPGVPYNNNNKSVRMIRQNSFKSFLEYISVSNVM